MCYLVSFQVLKEGQYVEREMWLLEALIHELSKKGQFTWNSCYLFSFISIEGLFFIKGGFNGNTTTPCGTLREPTQRDAAEGVQSEDDQVLSELCEVVCDLFFATPPACAHRRGHPLILIVFA